MISFIFIIITVLFLNAHAHAGILTIYNTPYKYNSNLVNYIRTEQFVIGEYKPASPANSHRVSPLPATVGRTNVANTFNNMLKNTMLKNINRAQGENNLMQSRNNLTNVLTLHYPLNVYSLNTNQKLSLITRLISYKNEILFIEGYTDCSGTRSYNDMLAHERAETVANFLVQHGYKVAQLPSYGKYHTLKTASESRRIAIYVEK